MQHIGQKTRRVDGNALVKGKPVFADDISLPGMLYVKILRSPHAHAKITRIDTSAVEKLDGVKCVLTHKNTRRHFYTTAGQGYPEPSPRDTLMLNDTMRYVGDRVAVVAADTLELANEALNLIHVEYEILDAILDFRASIDNKTVIHPESGPSGIADPDRNIAAHLQAELGDTKTAFEQSEHIFEGTYSTPYAQQAHIEPHITLSWMDENGRLVIRSSTQVPFHVRRIVAEVLDFPVSKIRVIKPRIGGGFGGKQEILNEEICAAVTLATGSPARIELTREEEFFAARSRHPFEISFKIGVNADLTFNAIEMELFENCGAYGPHALTVMSVAAQKSLAFYRCDNVKVNGYGVYTNLPVAGAYRGYGAPQGFFALESIVDEISTKLNVDPIDLKNRNYHRKGDKIAIAKILGEGREGFEVELLSCGMEQCLEKGKELIEWEKYRDANENGSLKRGVGVACATMGSGIAGIDMGSVSIKMNEDGSFNLLAGATDLGTGSDTMLAMIAAEILEVLVEKIIVYSSDTDLTPFDTGAYASSTTYISGGAVKKCAEDVKSQILEQGKEILGCESAEIKNGLVIGENGKEISYSDICTQSFYTDSQKQIMATASHMSYDSPQPFNATFVDVTVDTESGIVKVNKVVSVTDSGKIINPQMAEGQAEGAIPQALGMALTEQMIFDENGAPINVNFNDYHIFTSIDMPEIVVKFVETDEPTAPFGAKAVAEIPITPPGPAIANAIFNACGVRIRSLPVKPEEILNGLIEKS